MRAVITGGSGFAGQHLTRALLRQGHEVVSFDRVAPPRWSGEPEPEARPGFTHWAGDVADEASLARVLTCDVDVVFHLASVVGVEAYCRDPLAVVDVNVLGTRNVLRLALAHGIKLVFASTSEVFGRNPALPWREDADRVLGSTRVDRWVYGTSKAICEHMLFAAHAHSGLPMSIVRLFNAYGPAQRPGFVVSRSIHRVLRGEPPLLYDGGQQTRCFTFIDDVVAGLLAAATREQAVGEAFNLAYPRETRMAEVVELILELAGRRGELVPQPVETAREFGERYQDIPRRVPEVAKARELLGWEARTELREGLHQTLAWSRQNPWWLERSD